MASASVRFIGIFSGDADFVVPFICLLISIDFVWFFMSFSTFTAGFLSTLANGLSGFGPPFVNGPPAAGDCLLVYLFVGTFGTVNAGA